MQVTKILARYALLPGGWSENVEVELGAHGIIDAIRTDVAVAGSSERILLAAQPNLHSHTFHRAMAGMTERRTAGRDSFWSWRTLMYRFLEDLTPEQIEAIAALAFVEMQEAGFASVAEFHYVHHRPGGAPYDNLIETSERIFAAASQTGIGLTHLPVLYSYGGAGEAPLAGGQLRFGNDLDRFSRLVETAQGAAARSLPGDARVGIAPHSLRATAPGQLTAVTQRFADGPIHIHVAEQPKEVDDIAAWLDARPVEWLLGALDVGPAWCLVHATHMSEAETEALARSGAVAGLCPMTEANLGDGPFNGPTYLAAGGAFGIGTDANVRISVAEELRMLEYSQRLRDLARNVLLTGEGSVGEAIYNGALSGGAQALRRTCGEIREGKLADLVALDGEHLAFSGLKPEQFLDGWIFAADDRVVRDVWSAGRHRVQDGRHVARDAVETRYRAAIEELTGTAGSRGSAPMRVTYRSVKARMLARIVNQEWAPGEQIPKEEDLAGNYGCSRATVNRALRELADEGLVERRRKAGTRVARRASESAVIRIPIVRAQIENSGRRYGYVLLHRSELISDSKLGGRLDVPENTPVLFLSCLHLADGEPYQLENRWISLVSVPSAAETDFEDISPNEWLVTKIPYTRSEHIFSAAIPTDDERERLRLRPDEPVFVIERRTWVGEKAVTYVRLSHLSSSYRIVSRDNETA